MDITQELYQLTYEKEKILKDFKKYRLIPRYKSLIYVSRDLEKMITIKKNYFKKGVYYGLYINFELYALSNCILEIVKNIIELNNKYELAYQIRDYKNKNEVVEILQSLWSKKAFLRSLDY